MPAYAHAITPAPSAIKNVLEYPTVNFMAEGLNESGAGTDGVYYVIPASIAATVIVQFKPVAVYVSEGVQRIRIACEDWSLRSGLTGAYVTDGTEQISAASGFPVSGSAWVDFVVDGANSQFIVTTGG